VLGGRRDRDLGAHGIEFDGNSFQAQRLHFTMIGLTVA